MQQLPVRVAQRETVSITSSHVHRLSRKCAGVLISGGSFTEGHTRQLGGLLPNKCCSPGPEVKNPLSDQKSPPSERDLRRQAGFKASLPTTSRGGAKQTLLSEG